MTNEKQLKQHIITLSQIIIENGLADKLPIFADPSDFAARYRAPEDGLDNVRAAIQRLLDGTASDFEKDYGPSSSKL